MMEIRLDDCAHPIARLFSQRIKERRKGLGLTQGQLGERANLAAGYISAVETGRANPTLDVILKLADAVEVEPWAMLRPDVAPSAPSHPAPLTIGDVDLSVRTTNIFGATSPASLIGEVLDNDAHPLRSKLRPRDLKELAEVRKAVGVP